MAGPAYHLHVFVLFASQAPVVPVMDFEYSFALTREWAPLAMIAAAKERPSEKMVTPIPPLHAGDVGEISSGVDHQNGASQDSSAWTGKGTPSQSVMTPWRQRSRAIWSAASPQ